MTTITLTAPAFDHIIAYYTFMRDNAVKRERNLQILRYAEKRAQYVYNNGNPR